MTASTGVCERAKIFSRGIAISCMRKLGGLEGSEIVAGSTNLNSRSKPLMVSADSFETEAIPTFPVRHILSAGSDAQIHPPIIESVAVAVIDFVVVFTSLHFPNNQVLVEKDIVDPYDPMTVPRTSAASDLAREPTVPPMLSVIVLKIRARTNLPVKFAAQRIVREPFAEPRLVRNFATYSH